MENRVILKHIIHVFLGSSSFFLQIYKRGDGNEDGLWVEKIPLCIIYGMYLRFMLRDKREPDIFSLENWNEINSVVEVCKTIFLLNKHQNSFLISLLEESLVQTLFGRFRELDIPFWTGPH